MLFIGQQRELITVHTRLLTQGTQEYINEQSQNEQVYQLPDEDPAIFRIYRSFLYTGSVFTISETNEDGADNGRSETHLDAEWTILAHGYLLGVTLRDEKFANACITAMIEKVNETERFPSGIATEVYQSTEPGNMLRRLIMGFHVWIGKGYCIRPPHEDADGPREFLRDVITGLVEVGGAVHYDAVQMPWNVDSCAYHVHQLTSKREK